MTFYADTESGIRLQDPTRNDLLDLIDGLNDADNTFIVVHPPVDDAEWFISVSKNIGTFGGYELDWHDPRTAERTTTTAATPTTIADDVLAWTHQR